MAAVLAADSERSTSGAERRSKTRETPTVERACQSGRVRLWTSAERKRRVGFRGPWGVGSG